MSERTELYRPVNVETLPTHGRTVELKANDAERAAIAERLGLLSLDALDGDILVKPAIGREIVAEGPIRAKIVQTCVVTGQPLATELEFSLERRYAEGADSFAGLDADEDEITDPEDEGPDPIEGGEINVGEAAVEELALQIPPYPRTPGAEFAEFSTEPGGVPKKENPFAALADLKKRLESEE